MMINNNGNKTFESITEAGFYILKENAESARKNISRALNKGGTAYNSKWIYI